VGTVFIADLLTGRRIVPIPYTSYRWSQRRNRADECSATVDVLDDDVRALDLRNAATPGKTALAIVEEIEGGEWFACAGPLGQPSYDRDGGKKTLPGKGMRRFFEDRTVLPSAALDIDPADFVIPDPADTTKTMPNPALKTEFTGWSLGTIIKKLIEQMMTWPASDLPIVLPADVAGTHEKTYQGVDFKSVESAISDLIARENGPDVALAARYQEDRRGVEWVLTTGTDEQPAIRSTSVHRWDLSAKQTSTKGLKVDWDGDGLASVAWATGGRSLDVALVERVTDSNLIDSGFPLRETVNTSHTDVVERPTLRAYAAADLGQVQGLVEVWIFDVKKDEKPYLGQYNIGDLCDLIIVGDPEIPDSPPGGYRREIAALSGDEGDWVTVTTVEVGS